MSTITIAIDIRLLGQKRTGDETVFFNLTRSLIRRKDPDLRYVLLTNQSDVAHMAWLRTRLECMGRDDIDIVALSAKNRFTWNAIALPRFLAAHAVDILHTQYILPLWVPKRTRVVAHIHDLSFMRNPHWIATSDRLFLRILLPRTFRRAEALVVPSQFTRDELGELFPETVGKIHVISNAAASEWSKEMAAHEKKAILESHGLHSKGYFISFGTLQPRKNIPFLIRAFEKARERGVNDRLVLVGDAQGHNVDPALLKGKGASIVWTGYVEERSLRALVEEAKAFVFPSLYEGFGLPILEAFACKTPVIASQIKAFQEVAGDAIMYFDPANLDSASHALYTFSIDPGLEERYRVLAREAQGKYSWEKSAESLARLYRAMVSNKPKENV